MFSRAMVILCLLMPVASVAQERQGVIYKCVDRAGHVAYQTDRCRPGTEVRDVKVFTDRGIDPNLARKVEADRRALAARRRQTPGYSFGVPRAESDKVRRCREAKADRDRVLKQLGLRTTYDLRRRLDDRVYDACKLLSAHVSDGSM